MSNTQNAENTQKQNTLRMAYLSLMGRGRQGGGGGGGQGGDK
jgi:hypothetical protein